MTDLYDQLSKAYALQGGDLPTTPEQTDELPEWDGAPMLPEQMIRLLFTGFDLPAFAHELAQLQDGLPLPEVFDWRPATSERETLAVLQPEELRTFRAFQQVVEYGRKSGKYLQAMQDLFAVYPDLEPLALLISQYLCIWQPEAHFPFVEAQLQAHPDWRVLRYVYAGYLLLRQTPVDQTTQTAFLAQLNQQLELHLHLQENHPDAWEVLAFYQTQATWFVFGQLHLERALYAINVCQQVLNEIYPDPKDHPPEAQAILQAWFECLTESSDVTVRIRHFLKPLLLKRTGMGSGSKEP